MQLHYSLIVIVVIDISDIKVMSSTVAVIFAITWVVNNYNILTKPRFLTEPNQTHSKLNPSFFQKPNRNKKKSVLHIPSGQTGHT